MERSIARSLEPDLRAACDGALGELSWVRMDWQHGGALTGISEFTDASGTHPVFVKFPVPGRELCKRNFRGKRWWVLEKLWSLMQRVRRWRVKAEEFWQ